jgi:hypothetical protein
MFVHTLHSQLTPLIIISAVVTAFAFFLIPPLKLGKKMPGEKVKEEDK